MDFYHVNYLVLHVKILILAIIGRYGRKSSHIPNSIKSIRILSLHPALRLACFNFKCFPNLCVLTIVMKTKTFTVLANRRAFMSKNAKKNLKDNEKTIASAGNYVDFPRNLFCFRPKFCLRNDTELGNESIAGN